MIRKFEPGDTEEVIRIFTASCEASHGFLSRNFLEETRRAMRNGRLLREETFVCERDGACGFISLEGERYISALFVDPARQRNGIGRELVGHAKARADELALAVFVQNEGGILFYHREGFYVVKRRLHAPAGEDVLQMRWTRGTIFPAATP